MKTWKWAGDEAKINNITIPVLTYLNRYVQIVHVVGLVEIGPANHTKLLMQYNTDIIGTRLYTAKTSGVC